MNLEIVEAFKEIARDKNIDRDSLADIIENIFLMMIKRKYGSTDKFDVIVNMEKGEIEIFHVKTIVENVTDPQNEIDLESAQKIEPELQLGDEFIEVLSPESFGRRLIISAKQNLSQKIKEAEKEAIFSEFKNRIGEIIIGDIQQINRDEIFLNLEKTEVVLPKSELIYNERYRRGDSIRAIIKDVVHTSRGPEIVASRTSPLFLIRLFELEVPEIYDGIIEIKAVAREPGDRAKVAVESNDKRIDAVGACVGMKGVRIQSIVKELNNEKIDIIPWNSDPAIFIAQSLSPAKPLKVDVKKEDKTARAIIPDDQISLAIGRGGQNIRLASVLTGYKIESVKESEIYKKEDQRIEITAVESLSPNIREKLLSNGLETAEAVLDAGVENLTKIPGIGKKTAEKILQVLDSFYEK